MTSEADAGLLPVLKAIADGSRLRILGLLAQRELSVGTIANELALSEPTISHHLGRLTDVDFVAVRQAGTSRFYRLNVDAVARFQRSLATQTASPPVDASSAESAERAKILRSFVKEGRLVKIPEALKKRRVVLEWLVDMLDGRKRYTEKEINAFLKRFHEDYATLRRELIDRQYMRREESIYWRI